MKIYTILCLFFISHYALAQERITISGFVKEQESEELLTGVNVYIPGTSANAVTNNYGFYSLTISPIDSVDISYSLVGYEKVDRRV